MLHSSRDQGGKGSLHLVPSLYPSCAEITAYAIVSAVEERSEEKTKTPYLLDIRKKKLKLGRNVVCSNRVYARFLPNYSRHPQKSYKNPRALQAEEHTLGVYPLNLLSLGC